MTQERTGEQPRDISILNEVATEWMARAGADISVRTVISYLGQLHQSFGEGFTIEGASIALDRLSQDALAIKQGLIDKKTPPANNSNP